jgi:hypothetical protein
VVLIGTPPKETRNWAGADKVVPKAVDSGREMTVAARGKVDFAATRYGRSWPNADVGQFPDVVCRKLPRAQIRVL